MTLTTTYRVSDADGVGLEIEAEDGKVYVTPTTDWGLGLTIDEAFDLEDAIHRAIEDAVGQEAELVESDDDLDTLPEGWVEIGHTEPGSFFWAPVDEVENGQLYTTTPRTYSFSTPATFKVYDPSIGVAPAVADFFD